MKYHFTEAALLARLQQGPARLSELAQGSQNAQVRRRVKDLLAPLLAAGQVRHLWLEGYFHYALVDYETPPERRVQILLDNCRPVDGCMLWAGYTDAQRGPVSRIGKRTLSVRRYIWSVKRGPLGRDEIIQMLASCGDGCVQYRHMSIVARGGKQRGRPKPPAQAHLMAEAKRRQMGRLDWDKVRAIRQSDEPQHVLAERYGVSRSLIGQVRRHEIWRVAGGVFSALLRRAA